MLKPGWLKPEFRRSQALSGVSGEVGRVRGMRAAFVSKPCRPATFGVSLGLEWGCGVM